MPTTMTVVISSNVYKVGYDADEERLYISFRSGGTWVYLGVPYETYLNLVTADSVGKFFHSNIRSQYAAHRISPP